MSIRALEAAPLTARAQQAVRARDVLRPLLLVELPVLVVAHEHRVARLLERLACGNRVAHGGGDGFPITQVGRDVSLRAEAAVAADEVLEVERLDLADLLELARRIVTFGPNGTRPLVIQSDANKTLLPSTKRTTVLSGA